jgi:hypothetical protein
MLEEGRCFVSLGRHRHLVEEWIEGGVGVRIGEALELDPLVGKQLPNHWRLP